MKVFEGGLICCGFFSQHHQEAWLRMPTVRIVASCDRRIEKAKASALEAFSSAEEMLTEEDLDFSTLSVVHSSGIDFSRGDPESSHDLPEMDWASTKPAVVAERQNYGVTEPSQARCNAWKRASLSC